MGLLLFYGCCPNHASSSSSINNNSYNFLPTIAKTKKQKIQKFGENPQFCQSNPNGKLIAPSIQKVV